MLVSSMDSNNTKDRHFLTCVCGEPRRRTERGSSIRGPEPVVGFLAHNRQGSTCVHFHGGFGFTEHYRDFDRGRGGPCSGGVVETTHHVHGLVCMHRLELVIPGFSPTASCRPLVTGLLAADGCKVTDLPAVVANGGLELAGGW